MAPEKREKLEPGPKRPRRSAKKRKLDLQAWELMTKVVQTLPSSSTIKEALTRMNQYRIDILPLVSHGRVVGAVGRDTADGAVNHGLGKARVQDVATEEVPVILPDMLLPEIRRIFLERHLGFVLVGRNRSSYQGFISRMQLFEHLAELGAIQDGRRIRIDSQMEKLLPPRILKILHTVRRIAEAKDLKPYLVGGLVRDLLLKRTNSDVDLVVEADGITFGRYLQEELGGEIKEYKKFQTAVLVLPDGFKIDIASSRTEYYPKPGSLPRVQRGDIHHDLYRRDFTINAIAVELHPKRYGRLVDLFGGNQDLENRQIRVLHSLSFIEDPTRALRAVRFANRLSFTISPDTSTFIRVAVRKKVFRHLSGERLLREIIFILMENRPLGALRMLSQLGLLTAIHPSLGLTSRRYGLLSRVEKILNWYDALPSPLEPLLRWQVYLLAMTDSMEKRRKEAVLNRLAIRGRTRDFFLGATRVLQNLDIQFQHSHIDRARIYTLCSPHRAEILLFASAKTMRKPVRRSLANYLTQLTGTQLEISGKDLRAMGLVPGPVYSKILREVLRNKIRGEISGRKEEIAFAKQLAEGHI